MPLANPSLARISLAKKRSRAEFIAGYCFIAPWLVGFFALTLLPILASLVLSFTDYDLLSPPKWVGLANYKFMLFEDQRFWNSVRVTLYYAIFAVPLRLAVALGIAIALNGERKMQALYRAVYYAPSVVGESVAVAVMWRQIFGGEGLLNSFIMLLGGKGGTVWLGDPRFAIWSLILLAAWQFGSPMLIFLAGLKQIPTELYESANMDGAGPIRKFLKITLPMLTPIILFNLVMQMISGFIVFTPALIITGGGPIDSTNFFALYLYKRAFEDFGMGIGSGMAWLLLTVVALLSIVVFKTSSRWVFYESEGK
ncbi:sugar ABC transporter permease [Treponema sp.]